MCSTENSATWFQKKHSSINGILVHQLAIEKIVCMKDLLGNGLREKAGGRNYLQVLMLYLGWEEKCSRINLFLIATRNSLVTVSFSPGTGAVWFNVFPKTSSTVFSKRIIGGASGSICDDICISKQQPSWDLYIEFKHAVWCLFPLMTDTKATKLMPSLWLQVLRTCFKSTASAASWEKCLELTGVDWRSCLSTHHRCSSGANVPNYLKVSNWLWWVWNCNS